MPLAEQENPSGIPQHFSGRDHGGLVDLFWQGHQGTYLALDQCIENRALGHSVQSPPDAACGRINFGNYLVPQMRFHRAVAVKAELLSKPSGSAFMHTGAFRHGHCGQKAAFDRIDKKHSQQPTVCIRQLATILLDDLSKAQSAYPLCYRTGLNLTPDLIFVQENLHEWVFTQFMLPFCGSEMTRGLQMEIFRDVYSG